MKSYYFKFLHLDKIPPWAYEVAKEPDFTLIDKEKMIVVEDFIEVKKIVGTTHRSFCNQTWIHNLRYPTKPYNLLEAMKNLDYYTKTLGVLGYEKTLGFVKIDDEIYIYETGITVVLLQSSWESKSYLVGLQYLSEKSN